MRVGAFYTFAALLVSTQHFHDSLLYESREILLLCASEVALCLPVYHLFILLPKHNRHTRLPIPITPPQPPILKPLLLPNLHLLLHSLQTLLARPPSRLPVRSTDGNQNALFPDIDPAEAVRDADADEAVIRADLGRDGLQRAESEGRVGGVCEVGDGLVVEGVARAACMWICSVVWVMMSVC